MKFTTLFALVGATSAAEVPSMLHQIAAMAHADQEIKTQNFMGQLAQMTAQNGEELPQMLHQMVHMTHADQDMKAKSFMADLAHMTAHNHEAKPFLANLAQMTAQNGVEESPMSFVHHLADLAIQNAEPEFSATDMLAMATITQHEKTE